MLDLLHSAYTRWRRRHPGRMRRLAHPVVSILSRGYARERKTDTPVVVRTRRPTAWARRCTSWTTGFSTCECSATSTSS